ncbi:MAG: exo-beta-N-acetylmuramidase NamZ domain-containing protein [Trueperaceae bacterium]
MSEGRPLLGIDRFLDDPVRHAGGARLALLTNQAAALSDGRPTLEATRASPHADLVRLFTFEHGFSGFGQDARPVADDRDPRSGLPRYSLYGPRRRPERSLLSDLDAVVVDVQEVGVRAYTYATTVALLLEAAADAGTRVVICDRPNLLGARVAGPPLDPDQRSFLGYLDVPFQHGLTLGEAMRWHADGALNGAADLTVVPLRGWRRDRAALPGPFVPPSPGLPRRDAVALYPGLVLLEGVNVSEGRGTPAPFSLLGAPWLEGYALAEALNRMALPGLWARPLDFRPESGPFAGRPCHGVQLHVTDAAELRAFEAGVRILAHLRERHGDELVWRDAADMPWSRDPDAGRVWHEPSRGALIDGLAGSTDVRGVVDGTRSLDDALDAWRSAGATFAAAAEPSLLYAPPPEPR